MSDPDSLVSIRGCKVSFLKFDKNKLPSRHVSVGPERAPHRSYYYAMGLNEDDIGKPFVGVVSTWNEAAPCNIALMRQAQSVKKGVTDGKKHVITVPLTGANSIPHATTGRFGAARLVLRPSAPGSGVIAGGSTRIVLELAGVKNILSKHKNTVGIHSFFTRTSYFRLRLGCSYFKIYF